VRLLNFEMIAHPQVAILSSDINNTVKNSPEMVNSLIAAAERVGVPYLVKPYTFGTGGSDAGSFSEAGIAAATLLAFKMPQQMVAFYHQEWDSPKQLAIEPLLNVLKIASEWIRNASEC
jgi:hypothetical protein